MHEISFKGSKTRCSSFCSVNQEGSTEDSAAEMVLKKNLNLVMAYLACLLSLAIRKNTVVFYVIQKKSLTWLC